MYTPNEIQSMQSVTLNAFVQRIRKASGLTFVTLRHGNYYFQGVYIPDLCKTSISELCEGAYIKAEAEINAEKRAPYGFELTLKDFTVISKPEESLPFSISQPDLGATLEEAILSPDTALKHPKRSAIMAIRGAISFAYSEYMQKNGYCPITTPKLVPTAYDRSYISVKYFDNTASLAHSPTPYLIMATGGLGKVYEIGSGYSTKHGNSIRHLNEFTRLDFETAYTTHNDLENTLCDIISHAYTFITENHSDSLAQLGITLSVPEEIPSITYSEAMSLLHNDTTSSDLDPTDERKLSEWAKSKHNSDYLFVTNMPQEKRPCYEHNGFVLLLNGIEIASGGEHKNDYNALSQTDTNVYPAYLCACKNALPPSGGIGIGLERFVMALLKLSNIREATFITRDFKHISP